MKFGKNQIRTDLSSVAIYRISYQAQLLSKQPL